MTIRRILLLGGVMLCGCAAVPESSPIRTRAESAPASIEIAFFDVADASARKVELEKLLQVFAANAELRGAFACTQESGELRCLSLDRGKGGHCEPLYEAFYRSAGTLTLRKTYLTINVVGGDAGQCFSGRKTFAELRDLLQAALEKEFGHDRVRTQDLSRGEVRIDHNTGKIKF
jgi:hypothetical protein